MKPLSEGFTNCLAWHMRCAEPVRMFPKPSRWWRWLVVAGVPGVALLVLAVDWARVAVWWLS